MDREEALLVYQAFSVAELKEQISQRGLSSEGCVERTDLIELLLTDDLRQVRMHLCPWKFQPKSPSPWGVCQGTFS
jgi:hypothetical protein